MSNGRKNKGISFKIEAAMLAELESFENETGVDRSTLIRAAIRATLDHYQQKGSLRFPLLIVDSPNPKEDA